MSKKQKTAGVPTATSKVGGQSAKPKAFQKRNRRPQRRTDAEKLAGVSSEATSPIAKVSTDRSFYPSHKMAVFSAGNFIETAGQENFLSSFAHVTDLYSSQQTVRVKADVTADRTPVAMKIKFIPFFGATSTSGFMTSAVNQAVLFIKQFIDTNLGVKDSYDPQDLAPYVMAIADCITLTAEIKRNLRMLVMQITRYPYFIPHAMFDLLDICAPGEIPADDSYVPPTAGSAARYYAKYLRSTIDRLNQIINLLNGLAIPAELQLFGYNDDLFEHIYLDSDDPGTAQMYVFASQGSWVYSDDGTEAGSAINFTPWHKHPLTGRQWRSIDDMVDRLEQMVLAISAYKTNSNALIQNIRNAYGSARLKTIELMEVSDIRPLDMVYDPDMLTSIENITQVDQCVAGSFVASAETTSVQGCPYCIDDGGTVIQRYSCINLPLQFHKSPDQITKDDIGRALRFHPHFGWREYTTVFDENHPDGWMEHVITPHGNYGFAVVTEFDIGCVGTGGDLLYVQYSNRVDTMNQAYMVALLSDFKQAPPLLSIAVTSSETEQVITVKGYTSARDTELTLSPSDMQQWWVGLTEIAWGTNISRETRGQRA